MATISEDASIDERRRRRLEREKQFELEQQQWEIERKKKQEERQKRREARKNSQLELTSSQGKEINEDTNTITPTPSDSQKLHPNKPLSTEREAIENQDEKSNIKEKTTNEESIASKVPEVAMRTRYRGQTWASTRSREQLPSVQDIWNQPEKSVTEEVKQPTRSESPALERLRKREEERIKKEQERKKKLEEELRQSQLELERKEREIALRALEIQKREEELKMKWEEEDRKRAEERDKKKKEKEEQKKKSIEEKLKLEEKKKPQEERKSKLETKKKPKEISLDERIYSLHSSNSTPSSKESSVDSSDSSVTSNLLKDIFKELNSSHHTPSTPPLRESSESPDISILKKSSPAETNDTKKGNTRDSDDVVPSPRVSKASEEQSPSRYGSLRRHNELVKKIREEQDEWENERKAREENRQKRKEERRTKLMTGDPFSSSTSNFISRRSTQAPTPSPDPSKFSEPIQIPKFDSVNKYSDLDDLLSDLVNVTDPPKISRERSSSAVDLLSNSEREFIASLVSKTQENTKDPSPTSPIDSSSTTTSFSTQLLSTISKSHIPSTDPIKKTEHVEPHEKPFIIERSQSNIEIIRNTDAGADTKTIATEIKTRVPEERALSKSAIYSHEVSPKESEELQFAQIIVDKLYLGSCGAAGSKDKLKKAGITHILTVAHDFAPLFPKEFVYKVVKIEDNPREDLLQHFPSCLEFISQALETGKILVHCIAGKSRSVSTVAAYLIQNLNFTLENALNHIQQRRKVVNRAEINFLPQLEMFEQLKCSLSVREHLQIDYCKYKHFTLWEKLQSLHQHWKASIDESKLVPNDFEEKEKVYKCQKCEKVVFSQRSVIHSRWNDCEFVFIAPAKWMKDGIKQKNGDINCPHCKRRLGLYSWVPTTHSKCSCYVSIQPVFRVMCNKITFVHNLK